MYHIATFITGFLLVATSTLAQEATFEALGDLPGGDTASGAYGVSADGSVVVGVGNNANGDFEAFRWEDGDIEGLGDVPGGDTDGLAHAVSADGSVIVGQSEGENGDQAFRWEAGKMESLELLTNGVGAIARDISADGSVIVGFAWQDGLPWNSAVRWVDGEIENFRNLPEGESFIRNLRSVSANGEVMTGGLCLDASCNEPAAVRWEYGEELEVLDCANHDSCRSSAEGISADGSTVVGGARVIVGNDTEEAFRWKDGKMELLGFLESDILNSQATAVSANGSVVVGMSRVGSMNRAFIWSENDEEIQGLKEVLEEDYDLDLSDWILLEARDISNDGNVIVGFGINPDGNYMAWRAEAPFGGPVADETLPQAFANVLSAPTPNPTGGTSSFTIAVERGQHVVVEVFDVMGRQVHTVYEDTLRGGMSERLTLDASALPAGVYVIRAVGANVTATRRVTVVR